MALSIPSLREPHAQDLTLATSRHPRFGEASKGLRLVFPLISASDGPTGYDSR
jgi:hypothetical protein